MKNYTEKLLTESLGIGKKVLEYVQTAENQVAELFLDLDDIAAYNQYKVLDAFQNAELQTCISVGPPVTVTTIREEKPWKKSMPRSSELRPHLCVPSS